MKDKSVEKPQLQIPPPINPINDFSLKGLKMNVKKKKWLIYHLAYSSLTYNTPQKSFKIIHDLGLEEYSSSRVEFSHPFNPMQSHYMHQTFHYI